MSWLRFIPTSLPEHPLGDLAHLLRRQRAPQMLAALVLALLSAGLLLRAEARATAAERRWGTLSSVVVARTDLRAGSELGPSEVRLRRLPRATLAADALTETAWAGLTRGGEAPVIDRNVAEDEPIRSAILLGDGAPGSHNRSVVAFPAGTLTPLLEPGDRVRVVSGAQGNGLHGDGLVGDDPDIRDRPALGGGKPSSDPPGGVVVGPPTGPGDLGAADPTGQPAEWVAWVAVTPSDAAEVARIALSGSVALVLDGPEVANPIRDPGGDHPVGSPR